MEKELKGPTGHEEEKTPKRETEPSGLGNVYVFPIESVTSLAAEIATLKLKLEKSDSSITAMVVVKDKLLVNVEENKLPKNYNKE
ncbi:MAG: hypothetical protein V1928_02465 [Parcubacteria group bacterium]